MPQLLGQILLLQHFVMVAGEFESLQIHRYSTSGDFLDIVCALEFQTDQASRGVSFNSQTGKCEALSESWFSNQVHLPNSAYFKVYMREPVFEASKDISNDIIPTFVVGSSFVYEVRTGSSPSVGSLTIDIQGDNDVVCYHLNFRFWENTVKFNSYQGSWGYEISKTNPLSINTGYQLEVKYKAVALELYINGSKFQEFQHRLSMLVCNVIRCSTDVGHCLGLQYYYPL